MECCKNTTDSFERIITKLSTTNPDDNDEGDDDNDDEGDDDDHD